MNLKEFSDGLRDSERLEAENATLTKGAADLVERNMELQAENAGLRQQLGVAIEEKSVLSKMYELCGKALEQAKYTNTSFHRRVQHAEGKAQRKANKHYQKELRYSRRAIRIEEEQRYNELLEKYHKSDKKITELRERIAEAEERLERANQEWMP